MNIVRLIALSTFVVGIVGVMLIHLAQDTIAAYWPNSWLDRDFE